MSRPCNRATQMSSAMLAFSVFASSLAACTAGGAGESTVTTASPVATTTQVEPATTTTVAMTTTTAATEHASHEVDPADVAAANLATAAFQEVALAESAGYGSTIDALGCFENAEVGGMGLHYLNNALMDGNVDITTPEALVYELDSSGGVASLVAHEYIVPVEAWTSTEPPNLFGLDFHQHSVLPLWVLHAWIWKDNPAGMFEDFNPAVRLCPDGVPVFGEDLP